MFPLYRDPTVWVDYPRPWLVNLCLLLLLPGHSGLAMRGLKGLACALMHTVQFGGLALIVSPFLSSQGLSCPALSGST